MSRSADDLSRLHRAIESRFANTVAFLSELVRAESLLGHEEGAQRVVEQRLVELGFVVRSIDIGARDVLAHPESGIPLVPSTDRRCLVGALGGAGNATLALNGHVDVVSAEPTEDWTRPPFGAVVEDGRMFGRGAGDMKGGMAAMLLAVEVAGALGQVQPSIVFQSVIEEECTGNGSLAACLLAPPLTAAIVGEPTEGAINIAAPGIIWARVAISGRAGHAGTADERSNPIDVAYDVIGSLRELESELNAAPEAEFHEFSRPYLLNVGALHAGDWPATSPGRAELDVRLGFPISLSPQDAQDRFSQSVHRVAPDAVVEFRGFRARGYSLDPANPLVTLLSTCHAHVHGAKPRIGVTRATSDLRYFQPPVGPGSAALYGPTGGNYHAADEWVDLASIKEVAAVLALLLLRFPT